jgi:hypothetical protein
MSLRVTPTSPMSVRPSMSTVAGAPGVGEMNIRVPALRIGFPVMGVS